MNRIRRDVTVPLRVAVAGAVVAAAVAGSAAAALADALQADPVTLGAAAAVSSPQAILITTIGTLATVVVTQVVGLVRESRNRRWDLADRAAARQETILRAELQRNETIKTAIELARITKASKAETIERILENTRLTIDAATKADAAYVAANNFNEKLKALESAILAPTAARVEEIADRGPQIDEIAQTTADTNEKVDAVARKIEPLVDDDGRGRRDDQPPDRPGRGKERKR